jgi:creatinine amidohydrolase
MMHGWIPPERYFPYLTWTDVRDLADKANTVILQPVGAIEQHGPHLPVAVDAAICTGVLGEALKRVPREVPVLLPACRSYYGKSNEHIRYPGTITLSAEDAAQGARRGGRLGAPPGVPQARVRQLARRQPQVIEIAARDAHERTFPISRCFRCSSGGAEPAAAFAQRAREREFRHPCRQPQRLLFLLKLLPQQVRKDRLVCEYPKGLPQNSMISMEGALPFALADPRPSPRAARFGDATAATDAIGAELLDSLANGWAKLIGRAARVPATRDLQGPARIRACW